ncbi:MAG: hypothetical protein HYU86_03325 [Chloroflexi bacterium]|nr:hypothetical protein [Chloroflexota bacterium]
MSRVAERFVKALVVATFTLFFFSAFSLAHAAGPDVCGADVNTADDDIGVHMEVGTHRFSVKGVVTDMSGSPTSMIKVCGISIDVSKAKVRGNLAEAKDHHWLVSAEGRVNGSVYVAQEVRVHPQGKPSGEVGKPEGGAAAKGEDKDHGQGKGIGQAIAAQKVGDVVERLGDRLEKQLDQVGERGGNLSEARQHMISLVEDLIHRLEGLLARLKA